MNENEIKEALLKYNLLIIDGQKIVKYSILKLKCIKCNAILELRPGDILRKKSRSCQCYLYQHLIGTKIGCLTVIGPTKRNNNKQKYYQGHYLDCLCDCGKTISCKLSQILKENKKSCGCNISIKGKNNPNFKKGYKNISQRHWNKLINCAKRREIDFLISIEDAWETYEKQNRKCALSGIEIFINIKEKDTSASLDRIDSSKGYTKNNIQWVYKKLNVIKWNMNNLEFINWCKLIYNFNKEKIYETKNIN